MTGCYLMSVRPIRLSRWRKRRGFTLVQLLVVLGIAALLMSLALPAIMRARNSAKRSAIFYQLQMISTGLEAYKADFNGSYPPVDTNPAHPIGDNGAFALCRALFAPAPAGGTSPNLFDYQDGFGFKMGTAGKVYGPYLIPDNFRFGYAVSSGGAYEMSPAGTAFVPGDYARLMVADRTDKPILYCPALPTKPRFGTGGNVYLVERKANYPTGVVYFDLDKLLGLASISTPAMADYRGIVRQPGETDDTRLIADIKQMLGADTSGQISTFQKSTIQSPYILWSAGLDGQFGKVGDKAIDDVLLTEFGQ